MKKLHILFAAILFCGPCYGIDEKHKTINECLYKVAHEKSEVNFYFTAPENLELGRKAMVRLDQTLDQLINAAENENAVVYAHLIEIHKKMKLENSSFLSKSLGENSL